MAKKKRALNGTTAKEKIIRKRKTNQTNKKPKAEAEVKAGQAQWE